MTLHKLCKNIDFSSKAWKEYCQWRNYSFTSFESLDSSLWNSNFNPVSDEDWRHAIINGDILTDVVRDIEYALTLAKASGADTVLNFDFLNDEKTENVIGYEILDGSFSYSLLTNFGNNISPVNDCLGRNGLIRHRFQAINVHTWFLENMPSDGHVKGSMIFAVYKQSAQQGDTSEPASPARSIRLLGARSYT